MPFQCVDRLLKAYRNLNVSFPWLCPVQVLWEDGSLSYRSRRRYCYPEARGTVEGCLLEQQQTECCQDGQCPEEPTLTNCEGLRGASAEVL